MRLLVDSHVALWWLEDNPRLGSVARQEIARSDAALFSPVTPWELGIKAVLGKLELPGDLVAALVEAGFEPLPIAAEHGAAAPALPPLHADPFDRMLIAQARAEALTLVTADPAVMAYEVAVLDARR